jgi:hypothetical protein
MRCTDARGYELVRDCIIENERSAALIPKPIMVGMNVDLAKLINPIHPDKALSMSRMQLSITYTNIWRENVVYRLPKLKGTLSKNLAQLHFKEESIPVLEKTLKDTLKLFHEVGLTHNDVNDKNVGYFETIVLGFRLFDYGSVTQNDSHCHDEKVKKDLDGVKRIIEKVNGKFKQRQYKSCKNDYFSTLPSFRNKIRKKIGLSPNRPAQTNIIEAQKTERPTTRSRRILFN